ncbi:2Fe-2S iron-sulfur cluster binding domain-containing protein [Aestuariicella hydrocarbonica]|uniref:2Fe-2S iron-sulfur cluster binding domain-containing protein n=1 Tax=Pseudomaricurvus hydrocarbonicus TaxID=1470433 RepID=A0A9E5JUD9_9GAMM|nr:2Fe-2S iron-sulfur cluster-binding protein [Aestuariicella hydrocarbonica]NHO66734.1 2Fe-2S iron-sulfur cluster binding domain-containing protein [Aestuariicella hydrocarbonica]
MANVYVTDRQAHKQTIEINSGNTLMQAITDAGVADLLALCGGVCSCATCHVYIEDAYLDKLPPKTEDEVALLEVSESYRENSRLACQVRLTAAMDGMQTQIAPEE